MLKIKQALFLKSAVKQTQWPQDEIIEICFLGRSNVGKSSFLNTITNQNKLAKTSGHPGKTRLINFFLINQGQLRFVDVPGYGFARVGQEQKRQFALMMEEYLSLRNNLKAVFLLLDIRHRPTADDKLMLQYLQSKNHNIFLVATKVDKISKNNWQKQKKILLEELNLPLNIPIIMFSSFKKIGIDAVLVIFASLLASNEK